VGKSTISMGHGFNSYVCLPEGKCDSVGKTGCHESMGIEYMGINPSMRNLGIEWI
jgi:hypothetical protein